jgi:uncharacterized protein YcbK (DUF882 family)
VTQATASPRRIGRIFGPVLPRDLARVGTFVVALVCAMGFVHGYRPERGPVVRRPFGDESFRLPPAQPAPSALGRSGAVQMRFALPNDTVDFPLEVQGDPGALAYEWVRLDDSVAASERRPLAGSAMTAPPEPGFYQLALVRGTVRRIVRGLTISVLVPFEAKQGATIDGYRIGTFLAERRGGEGKDLPAGFVKVTAELRDVPLTKHLRVGDFLVRDGQPQWPRYTAISPRVLDKVELVVAAVARMRGDSEEVKVLLDVHSGFRSPSYNRTVPRAARDSRHQYGDAIDVAIDANGDGRLTASDTKLVARAVEAVEREHPDLVGGMGLYTSRRYNQPYVHIDVRGTRARWRG